MTGVVELLQSVWTIVVLVIFLGIVAWAYSGKRKKDFDEAAGLPFRHDPTDDIEPSGNKQKDSE